LPQFQKSIAKLGIDMLEIKYLLLTHHHDDHAGFASELVKKIGCRVIAHRNAVAPLKHGESEDTMKPVNRRVKFVFSLFTLFHRQFTFPPMIPGENDIVLMGDDFDLLKSIGVNGKILYTPGHSRDSISVLLSDGNAFVGDVAMNFLRLTGIGHQPIYVEDINTVYESWQRLIEQGAKVIYPAHGNPFSVRELER
jgi:glyoxylase-like metal-dependent hydrolase (beta-lactamase superfamily II)